MITDKEAWDYEKSNLTKVANEIKKQLDTGMNNVSNFKKEAIEIQKQMWEDVKCTPTGLNDLEDVAQLWQYQTEISNQARKYKFSYENVGRLERMLKSPYFGRIDFLEEGEKSAEQIYIGIFNLRSDNLEILVYDWRAPISGMFYDFETGLSNYYCPEGIIRGEMLLKRQYKIENMEIVYMFDSSISINDEMLKEILGKSTDNRMKTIVTSIQREQNTVIRDIQNKILVVEGPAGSGKTSIALHRAAYLLYKYRENIKSENILVFSPNHVFEDYISNVLPELGEENIQRSTFIDYFEDFFDKRYHIETMNQQMEYILSCNSNKMRLRCIKFKASKQFYDILLKYAGDIENGRGMDLKNIFYNGTLIISADEISELFKNDYSRFPYARRLDKLQQRLVFVLEQYEENRIMKSRDKDIDEETNPNDDMERGLKENKLKEEYEALKNEIINMTSCDFYKLYMDLFKDIHSYLEASCEQEIPDLQSFSSFTISQFEQNIINYEDMAPVLLLRTLLDTVSNEKSIKHVIIDEAQDYTAIHYQIIKKVFENCNMTILGDVNQSVNGYMNIGSFDNICEAFNKADTKSISLTKSYRSSKEIADFCSCILKSTKNTEQLNRQGNKPKIIKTDKDNFVKRLADDIIELKGRNYKLIAVICKTAGQCEALYKAINPFLDVALISNHKEEYKGGVVIIPSYLAKGLEFDAVLVNSIEDRDYFREEDRRVLYTVCTRALHELYLYYFKNISGFIQNINENLYINETGDV